MKIISLVFGVLLFATTANADGGYCSHLNDPKYFLERALTSSNRLSFVNAGGLGNKGVCWWHSRFTRAATYLAIFRPDLEKPSPAKAKKIISEIAHGASVVVVPGFRDLSEFSLAHHRELQKFLNHWQIRDGVFRHAWINGLIGSTKTTPEDLKNRMDAIYGEFQKRQQLLYLKIPAAGKGSHAVLVAAMERTAKGYRLIVVDSNESWPVDFAYEYGMTSLGIGPSKATLPYLQEQPELDRIQATMRQYCAGLK